MRNSILLSSIFAVLLLFGPASGRSRYETYSNVRFQYIIDYPADLMMPKTEADNADGRVFSAKKGAELRVWGQYNALFDTLQKAYKRDLEERGAGVTYKLLKNDSYVISGTSRGVIFYQKTIFTGKDGDSGAVFATFTLQYPGADKRIFDAVATRASKSFRFE